ncbi:hypothetical protein AB0K71_05950 [Streptomyces syringium]|uniref:hypothetical protein n=1 Tax=Streptomyces syringium TaxID=76729 RepID=UPI0034274C79
MTDTNPAAVLRAAADHLRTLATNAAHEGRHNWDTGHTLGSRSPVVVDHPTQPSVLIETFAARLERVNAFIAAMDPAVGLALAELLATEANVADDIRQASPELTEEQLAAWVQGPLAIARLLLGEDTGRA